MNALRASILLYRYGPFYIANRFFLMYLTWFVTHCFHLSCISYECNLIAFMTYRGIRWIDKLIQICKSAAVHRNIIDSLTCTLRFVSLWQLDNEKRWEKGVLSTLVAPSGVWMWWQNIKKPGRGSNLNPCQQSDASQLRNPDELPHKSHYPALVDMMDMGQHTDLFDDQVGSYEYAGGSSLGTFVSGVSCLSSTQMNSMTPSANRNVFPSTHQIQRSHNRPTPYPAELAIRYVRAFQIRRSSEVDRGQFVPVGVIWVGRPYGFLYYL